MRSRVRPIPDGQYAVALEIVVPIGFENVQIVETVALQFADDDFLKGRDAQLEKAVEVLKAEIAAGGGKVR